jgi:hypothetical protein
MKIESVKRASIEAALKALLPTLSSVISGPYKSKKYDLLWHGFRYPPKVVVAKALEIESGREFTTKGFSGGEAAANALLRKHGFEVVRKDGSTGQLIEPQHRISPAPPKRPTERAQRAESDSRELLNIRGSDH